MQNYPHFLENLYDLFEVGLDPLKRWFKPGSRSDPVVLVLETLGKRAVFDCKMCGQCILHSTGMTCPMNCPKYLRNGPCGGVRQDGTHGYFDPSDRSIEATKGALENAPDRSQDDDAGKEPEPVLRQAIF